MAIDPIPADALVFVDANIFIYHFASLSTQCTHFLDRVAAREIRAAASSVVIAELIHRRMIAEAVEKGHVILKNAVRKLKEKPEIVRGLTDYWRDVHDVLSLPIAIEPILVDDILRSAQLRAEHGLLTNDSLNLACMIRLGIKHIATHDTDFDDIKDVNVWRPSDI